MVRGEGVWGGGVGVTAKKLEEVHAGAEAELGIVSSKIALARTATCVEFGISISL
jgi:hypothetical protein